MRKYKQLAPLFLLLVAAIGGLVLWGFQRAAKQSPPFYRQALAADPAEQKAAGQEFERQALGLHNQLRCPGAWEARFTDDQINGWLASEVPLKFPRLLARGVSDPRVAIEPRRIQAALRYQRGGIETIIALSGEVYLTAEQNEVAIRIDHVRAGALPLPLADFMSEAAGRAAEIGFPLRWTEHQGKPVALLRLSFDEEEFENRRLILEQLDLGQGELSVLGRMEELEAAELARKPTEEKSPASQSAESDNRQP
jgi:hypothetical protein